MLNPYTLNPAKPPKPQLKPPNMNFTPKACTEMDKNSVSQQQNSKMFSKQTQPVNPETESS